MEKRFYNFYYHLIDLVKGCFFKMKMASKIKKINFFNLLSILKEYDLFNDEIKKENPSDTLYVINQGDSLLSHEKFISIENKCDFTYDIYYNDIHIHILNEEKNKIVQIYLKKSGDRWRFIKNENSEYDFSNPDNVFIEIYKWYNVTVLGKSGITDESYSNGIWDESVYKELCFIEEYINSKTKLEQVKESFKS